MHTVRTTMQPDREIEVDDATYLDFQRQGLLIEGPAPTVPTAPAAPALPAKKTAGSAGSKEN